MPVEPPTPSQMARIELGACLFEYDGVSDHLASHCRPLSSFTQAEQAALLRPTQSVLSIPSAAAASCGVASQVASSTWSATQTGLMFFGALGGICFAAKGINDWHIASAPMRRLQYQKSVAEEIKKKLDELDDAIKSHLNFPQSILVHSPLPALEGQKLPLLNSGVKPEPSHALRKRLDLHANKLRILESHLQEAGVSSWKILPNDHVLAKEVANLATSLQELLESTNGSTTAYSMMWEQQRVKEEIREAAFARSMMAKREASNTPAPEQRGTPNALNPSRMFD